MARRKSVEKQQSRQRTAATAQQKGRTEYTETVNKRNIEINRIQKEQADAKKKGFWEGSWMKIAGTILAIAAVSYFTGPGGAAAFIAKAGTGWAAAGAAAKVGLWAAGGTMLGMGVADLVYDPLSKSGTSPEEAMESAGNIQTENLHRGTYGSNYGEVFSPLTNLSKSAKAMADDYQSQKTMSYVFQPLTAGVSYASSAAIGGAKLAKEATTASNLGATVFDIGTDLYSGIQDYQEAYAPGEDMSYLNKYNQTYSS